MYMVFYLNNRFERVDPMVKIAIIGGTGVYDPSVLESITNETIITPYGIVDLMIGIYAGKKVAFISRHGKDHSIPPHLINYRANIWAIKKIGVQKILATTAVGSVNQSMKPGDFVLVDQFLDFTKNRISTFYEGGERGVVHVDLTNPYCPTMRTALIEAGKSAGIEIHKNGVYVCTEGPRFETSAEIRMFAGLGGDLVGMTNIPEAVLAREAEMCYSTVSMVTNFGAGILSQPLTHGEVLNAMAENSAKIRKLIMSAIELLSVDEDCSCQHALAEYGGFTL